MYAFVPPRPLLWAPVAVSVAVKSPLGLWGSLQTP